MKDSNQFKMPDDIKFTGSPEDFLDFIIHLSDKVIMGGTIPSLTELGNHFAKQLKLDLTPFDSFEDLLLRGKPTGIFTRRLYNERAIKEN